ncbi:hypothetical protein ACWA1F_09465 [Flavobacterium sp. 3-218]
MYTYLTRIKEVLKYQFHNDEIILLKGNYKEAFLTLLDNNFSIKDSFKEFTAYDFELFKDHIILTNQKAILSYSLDLNDSFYNLNTLDYILHIKGERFNSKYICYGEVDHLEYYLLIDLKTNKILKKMPVTLGFGFVQLFVSEDLIVSYRSTKGLIGVFTLDNKEIWKLNINTIFYTGNESEIKQLKVYKNAIIVASNNGISSIDITTGKVNWTTKTYALTIEIVDNIGYVCSSLSLYKINLDDGTMFDYGRENASLPNFDYKGKTYWASGYEVVYHDGLLWYRVYDSGKSFVIAINPHDGYYELINHIEDADKIKSIRFNNNRMYLLDIEGVLHIYEKS